MNCPLPHICFVAPNAYPLLDEASDTEFIGGAELQQILLARGLVQRGYKVSMICLNFGQDEEVVIDGITVHRVFRPKEGLPVIRFIWPRLTGFWRAFRKINADIYYHRAGSMLTGVMVAYCRRSKKGSIFAVAGDPVLRFKRDRYLYNYGVKNVDAIVVQNNAQGRSILHQFGRESFIVPSVFQMPAVHERRRSAKRILWVSTIRRIKQPELFLKLAESLPQYQFVMVGGPGVGEATLFESIQRRAGSIDNLEFAGFVPYSKVDLYFDDAILFINTSESEGFPNTFLQAWSHKVPTVSFVDSGAKSGEGAIGYVVGSMEKMTSMVEQLIENDAMRLAMGDRCARYVFDRHGQTEVLDQYETVFRAVVGSGQ